MVFDKYKVNVNWGTGLGSSSLSTSGSYAGGNLMGNYGNWSAGSMGGSDTFGVGGYYGVSYTWNF
jgi:hypothetical protein